MTVIDQSGQKVNLAYVGPNPMWQKIFTEYAGTSPLRWKYAAMLALRDDCGWTLQQIGEAFGHDRGHVCRCLEQIKAELRPIFHRSPEWTGTNPFKETSK
jgi:hypothetical protein